jgi:ribosome recycling factor
MMIEKIKKEAEARMKKSLDALKTELTKLRTGRAHPSLLDHVTVDYYGSAVPISQVANVAIEDSRTLSVTPWEKQMVQPIEKAIMTSDLGLNPNTAGTVIRIPMPPLTEERRKDMIKVVRHEGENAKVAIRNVRRDANAEIKQLQKDKTVGEDQARSGEEAVQKLTDRYVVEVDKMVEAKEKDLMVI